MSSEAKELRRSYKKLWSNDVTQGWLNNYLQKIVSDDDSNVLKRLAKGVYKFSDPRMPGYIKLVNLALISDKESAGN